MRTTTEDRAPVLLIGIGNPSRGDDALGPLCIERLQALDIPGVELLSDFQLQVEYALDLLGRERVIFIDATLDNTAPFRFEPVQAGHDNSYSSHAMSPAAVLQACSSLYGEAPPAWVMAIAGVEFELGGDLSTTADAGLDDAVAFLTEHLHSLTHRQSK